MEVLRAEEKGSDVNLAVGTPQYMRPEQSSGATVEPIRIVTHEPVLTQVRWDWAADIAPMNLLQWK